MFIPVRKGALQGNFSYSCMLFIPVREGALQKGLPFRENTLGEQVSVQSVAAYAKTQELCRLMRRPISLVLRFVPLLEVKLSCTQQTATNDETSRDNNDEGKLKSMCEPVQAFFSKWS